MATVKAKAKKGSKAKTEPETKKSNIIIPDKPKFINPAAAFYAKGLIKIEKETKLVGNSLVEMDRISSSMLAIDWVLGGGLVPTLYQFSGAEASGKTTSTLHSLGKAVVSNLSYTMFVDAEGTASPKYTNNIFKPFGLNVNDLLNDRSLGFTYYRSNVIERVFDNMVKRLDLMPSKIWSKEADSWMYVMPKRDEHFKNFMGAMGIKPDNKLSTENLYYAPASHGGPEAMIAVDSWAAMLPEEEEENQEKSRRRAIQAQAFSDHLKRISAKIAEKGVVVVGVNQLRKIPGQTYGDPEYEPCFTGNTTVLLADGSLKTIRSIVKNKLNVKVKSFNKETGEVSNKKVIAWKENKPVPTSELIIIGYNSFDKKNTNGIRQIECTKDHKIWTANGWVPAKSLSKNDCIYLMDTVDHLSNDAYQVFLGSILGDGSVEDHDTTKTFKLRFDTTRSSMHYAAWKGKVLDGLDPYDIKPNVSNNFTVRGKLATYRTEFINNPKLKELSYLRSKHSDWSSKKATRLFENIIDNLDIKGLAVWYMDDGSFYFDKGSYGVNFRAQRLSYAQASYACKKINEVTGCSFNVIKQGSEVHSIAIKGKEKTLAFFNKIEKFIHPTYYYKLFKVPQESYQWDFYGRAKKQELRATTVAYKKKSSRKGLTPVYDLTVEDNHTYFVGGLESASDKQASDSIAVSNCGEALKFFSGARVRFYSRAISADTRLNKDPRASDICLEPSVTGNGFDRYMLKELKNTKNKFGAPKLKTYMRVWVSDNKGAPRGIDPVYDMIMYLESTSQGKWVAGKNSYITFNLKPSAGEKRARFYNDQKIPYETFKLMILAEYTKDPEVIKLARAHWKAPFDLRKALFDQMQKDPSVFIGYVKPEKESKSGKSKEEAEEL